MDTKPASSQSIKTFIHAYLEKVRKHGVSDASAILFGSFARGTQSMDSDIDLCILSSTFGRDYHDEAVMLRRILTDAPLPMDIIPYNPSDLEDKYDSLASEIRKYGITVV